MATEIGGNVKGGAGTGTTVDLSGLAVGNYFVAIACGDGGISNFTGDGWTELASPGSTGSHIYGKMFLAGVPTSPTFNNVNYAYAVWANVGSFEVVASQSGSSSLWIAPLPTGTAGEVVHAGEDRWVFVLSGDGTATTTNRTYIKRYHIGSDAFEGIWDQDGTDSASSPTDQYLATPPVSDQFSGAQVALYFEEFIPPPTGLGFGTIL